MTVSTSAAVMGAMVKLHTLLQNFTIGASKMHIDPDDENNKIHSATLCALS